MAVDLDYFRRGHDSMLCARGMDITEEGNAPVRVGAAMTGTDQDKEKTAKLVDIDSDAAEYVKYMSVTIRRRRKTHLLETKT